MAGAAYILSAGRRNLSWTHTGLHSQVGSAGFSWKRSGAYANLGAGTCFFLSPRSHEPPSVCYGDRTLFRPLSQVVNTPLPSFQEGGAAYLEGREISTFPSGSFCLPRFGATVLAAQSFLVTGVEGVLVPSDNPVQSPPPWVTGSGI